MKLVATVGLTGAGKSEVTNILEKEGFHKIRFGDITEELIKKEGREINEANERSVRENLRQQYGMAAYAKINLPKIKQAINEGKKVVIDGLYSWEEYKILKEEFPEMVILSVQASPVSRYSRLEKRDVRPLTRTESSSRDISEIENINKAGPISMADYTILNEGSIDDLKSSISRLLGKKSQRKRLDWDEYFMNIADNAAARSTCDRKYVGSVIVRDKTILSTGYNGSIRGLPHCTDEGHLMVNDHCVATVHAEANAIIQAAKNGININKATLYTTASPCWDCFKLIVNSGVKRIVFGELYRDPRIYDFARKANIELVDMSKTNS
tara:strand:+ start:1221 stop:2195 length:975 start_codon:yes stop_codon:yes gene_type:complete